MPREHQPPLATQATRSHTHTTLFREFPVWVPLPQTPIYTSVDPCIQCTKRSVFERSVFECGASKLFFDFFSDYPLDAVASERAFSSNFRRHQASERSFSIIFRRLEASKRAFSSTFRREEASEPAFSNIFDVWRLRSEHFRRFSTSGGSAARIFEAARLQSHHAAKPHCTISV